jgi:dTDP-4-dehydrorhamnose reductase
MKNSLRVLVLGASGLIGHKLLQELSSNCEVFGTLRNSKKDYGNLPLFAGINIIENIDVLTSKKIERVLLAVNPDIILNCIGITKRKIDYCSPIEVITVNSIFPHKLADWAKIKNKKVIHFSTDCVFDGRVGNYSESSTTTASDVYGKTKALGEINYNHTLTIRSSFVGQELFGKTELLEWFLAQDNKNISGYRKTLYSGVSTIFMAHVIKKIILEYPELTGLYNLALDQPISKYELLCIAKEAFHKNITITPDDINIHVPTLDATKLKKEINLKVPTWDVMMKELAQSNNLYRNY